MCDSAGNSTGSVGGGIATSDSSQDAVLRLVNSTISGNSAGLPGGVAAAYGGSFLAIPRRADAARKAAAWDLIRLLTLDRGMQLAAFKSQDAFPSLLAAHDDPFFAEPLPFLGGQPARTLWRDTARRITAVQVHRQDAFAEEVVNTELDKVLDQGKAVAAALADAKRQIERRARR